MNAKIVIEMALSPFLPASVSVMSLARRVAKYNVSVLITGETGTGKECIAKYIHENACGSDAPYVGVNCAAIPESMLEAILFGYEKGAVYRRCCERRR